MPGLIRGVARTAVIAGTATAVSGRVQRHQAEKYAGRDAQIYAERQQAYQQQTGAPVQYVQPVQYQPAAYAAPQPTYVASPAPAPPAHDDLTAQLARLGQLKAQGILTDDEFAAAKAKLIG